jgi:hypothetical protein
MWKLKLILFTFLVTTIINSINSQSLQWAHRIGAGSSENGRLVKTDNLDNIILAGVFSGSMINGVCDNVIDFDPSSGVLPVSFNGTCDLDVFVSKFTTNGQVIWAKSIGGLGQDDILDMEVDDNDNIYITGTISSNVDFDPSPSQTILSASNGSIFIAKYNSLGDLVFAKNFGSGWPTNINIDSQNNIILSGSFTSNFDFDPGPNTQILNIVGGFSDAFLASYNLTGDINWAFNIGSSDSDVIRSIETSNNEIYVAGYYGGTADFDPSNFSYNLPFSGGYQDGFFGKYTNSGQLIWVKKIGSIGADDANLKLDPNGNLVLYGGYSGPTDFDPSNANFILIPDPQNQNSQPYIAKYTINGDFISAKNINKLGKISFDEYSNIYILSSFSDQFVDFDPSSIEYNIYNVGYSDISIAKYTANVDFVWARSIASVNGEEGSDMTVNSNGEIIFTGRSSGNLDLDPGAGSFISNGFGDGDIIIAKYFDCSFTPPVSSNLISISDVSCNGGSNGSSTIFGSGGIPPLTYLWSNGQTTASATNLTAGAYTGIVYDINQCEDTTNIVINEPTGTNPIICIVTVDSLSQNNLIAWDKTIFTNQPIDSFIVHREVQSGIYLPLGSVSFNDLSIFVDTFRNKYFQSPYWSLGDPNSGTYRYKLQWKDSCGNLSPLSGFHNTIFMTNNNGIFTWPQLYTIENSTNPVSQYLLLRDNFNNGNWQVVNSVTGSQQSITDPAYNNWSSTANYRIQTQWNTVCTPSILPNDGIDLLKSTTFTTSQSNSLIPSALSIENQLYRISVYPNPTKDGINIYSDDFTFMYTISDQFGNVVLKNQLEGNINYISLENLSPGVYIFESKENNFTKRIMKF